MLHAVHERGEETGLALHSPGDGVGTCDGPPIPTPETLKEGFHRAANILPFSSTESVGAEVRRFGSERGEGALSRRCS